MRDESEFMVRLSYLNFIKRNAGKSLHIYRVYIHIKNNGYVVQRSLERDSMYRKFITLFTETALIPCNCYSTVIYDKEFIKKLSLNMRVSLFVRYY